MCHIFINSLFAQIGSGSDYYDDEDGEYDYEDKVHTDYVDKNVQVEDVPATVSVMTQPVRDWYFFSRKKCRPHPTPLSEILDNPNIM